MLDVAGQKTQENPIRIGLTPAPVNRWLATIRPPEHRWLACVVICVFLKEQEGLEPQLKFITKKVQKSTAQRLQQEA